jgi:hypothetical protein
MEPVVSIAVVQLLPMVSYWWTHIITYRKAPSALRLNINQDFERAI